MIYFLSTEAATLLGIVLIIYVMWLVIKSVAGSIGTSSDGKLRNIEVSRTVSPAGTARVTEAFYYETPDKYAATVECKALKDSKFIVAKNLRDLQERIDKAFDEYDRQVGAK